MLGKHIDKNSASHAQRSLQVKCDFEKNFRHSDGQNSTLRWPGPWKRCWRKWVVCVYMSSEFGLINFARACSKSAQLRFGLLCFVRTCTVRKRPNSGLVCYALSEHAPVRNRPNSGLVCYALSEHAPHRRKLISPQLTCTNHEQRPVMSQSWISWLIHDWRT